MRVKGGDVELFHGHALDCPWTIEGDWNVCNCDAVREGTQVTNHEDRVAPRTAAGRQLAADLPDIREWVGRIEAEAASLDRDELRKAVDEALALVAGPGNGTWTRSRPIEEWQRLWHLFENARALLSAGDKAE